MVPERHVPFVAINRTINSTLLQKKRLLPHPSTHPSLSRKVYRAGYKLFVLHYAVIMNGCGIGNFIEMSDSILMPWFYFNCTKLRTTNTHYTLQILNEFSQRGGVGGLPVYTPDPYSPITLKTYIVMLSREFSNCKINTNSGRLNQLVSKV